MLIPIMRCITQIIYIAHIIRRILKTVIDRSLLDDKVRAWAGVGDAQSGLLCVY